MRRASLYASGSTQNPAVLALAGALLIGVVFFAFVWIASMTGDPHLTYRAETGALARVRTINTAEVVYASNYPKIGFSPNLAVLGSGGADCSHPTAEHACLIDGELAAGVKQRYVFRYAPVESKGVAVAYTLRADPLPPSPPSWQDRLLLRRPLAPDLHLFSDESGVIRFEHGREAGPHSQPLN